MAIHATSYQLRYHVNMQVVSRLPTADCLDQAVDSKRQETPSGASQVRGGAGRCGEMRGVRGAAGEITSSVSKGKRREHRLPNGNKFAICRPLIAAADSERQTACN